MTRYFHLYADRHMVKEIDYDLWRKYAMKNWEVGGYKRMICILTDNEIYFFHKRGITIPLKQLKQILEKEPPK